MKQILLKLFLLSTMSFVVMAGKAQDSFTSDNVAWNIRLTEEDGLLGVMEEHGHYQYCSSLFQLPEPTTSIRFTVVETVQMMSVNGFPFTAIAEFVIRDAEGRGIPYTAYTNSDEFAVSGEHPDNGEGLAALSDNNISTFYHSIWRPSDAAPNEYHYLEFAFEVPVKEFSLDIVWRYGMGGERLRATLAYLTPGNSEWNGSNGDNGDENGNGGEDNGDNGDNGDENGNVDGEDDGDIDIIVTAGEAIDLGLSVMWSSCNIGAETPEDYGEYFQWSGMDIANDILGGNWYMPTLEEGQELIDKCSWQWSSLNGVNGCAVTGPNGNSIFLPATGWSGNSVGIEGNYWTITPSGDYRAYDLQFHDDGRVFMDVYGVISGLQVIRPVYRGDYSVIENVSTDNAEKASIYDICGRKITNVITPGIYFINGKKVVIK